MKKISASGFLWKPAVLLLLFALSFQALFSAKGSPFEGWVKRVYHAIQAGQPHQNGPQFTNTGAPQQSAVILTEAGLTTEEDEERKTASCDFFKSFSGNNNCIEAGYNRYLKHRFLHINAQVNSHPAIPYFILYHSWKSDLS